MDKICYIIVGAVVGVLTYKCVCDKQRKKEQEFIHEQKCRKKRECVLTPYEYKKCK